MIYYELKGCSYLSVLWHCGLCAVQYSKSTTTAACSMFGHQCHGDATCCHGYSRYVRGCVWKIAVGRMCAMKMRGLGFTENDSISHYRFQQRRGLWHSHGLSADPQQRSCDVPHSENRALCVCHGRKESVDWNQSTWVPCVRATGWTYG